MYGVYRHVSCAMPLVGVFDNVKASTERLSGCRRQGYQMKITWSFEPVLRTPPSPPGTASKTGEEQRTTCLANLYAASNEPLERF